MTKEQKTEHNYKQWRIDEEDIGDEEILYRVNRRRLFYIAGEIFIACIFLTISYLAFFNTKDVSWQSICIATILFLVGIRYFMSVISFDELIITKDRVIIKRFFVRDECIYIGNIKDIFINYGVRLPSSTLFFTCKNERFYQTWIKSRGSFCISSLEDEDSYKIEELIKTLQQKHNNGKQ